MAESKYFILGDKLIIHVEGDVYSIKAQKETEDIFYNLNKAKVNRVVIYNEQGRSRSFLTSSK
ncbi:hypothetical protein [Planococcus plakortidis]|uniref:hypothetical protein n=1 Tax=Planococcus plakortidis TaxID=1038856 RepID=UPI00386DD04C